MSSVLDRQPLYVRLSESMKLFGWSAQKILRMSEVVPDFPKPITLGEGITSPKFINYQRVVEALQKLEGTDFSAAPVQEALKRKEVARTRPQAKPKLKK